MSRSIVATLALGGLVLMGTGRAYAQGAESLRATIPFDFKVGRATLPAGQYGLSYDPAEAQGVLTVRSADGRHEAFAMAAPVDVKKGTPRANRLRFERAGTSYVLSEVFAADASVGLEVFATHPR